MDAIKAKIQSRLNENSIYSKNHSDDNFYHTMEAFELMVMYDCAVSLGNSDNPSIRKLADDVFYKMLDMFGDKLHFEKFKENGAEDIYWSYIKALTTVKDIIGRE